MKRLLHANILSIVTSVYICLLSVFILYTGINGYQDILKAKYTAFLAICGGYTAIMIILIFEFGLLGYFKLPAIKQINNQLSWAQKFIILYLLLSILSTIFSPHSNAAFIGMSRYEGLLTIIINVLLFLFVSLFAAPQKWMLYLFGGVVCVFSVLSFIQLSGLNPFTLYPEGYSYYGAYIAYSGAYIGTVGNTNLAAAFLCLIIPVLWASILRLKGKQKFWLLIPLLSAILILIKIKAEGGLLGIVAGGLCAFPIVYKFPQKRRLAILCLLGVFFLACLLLTFFIDFNITTLHEAHEILNGRIEDSFGSWRIYIWRNVLELVPNNLLFGHGPDTLLAAGIKPFSHYNEQFGMLSASIDMAHNDYLNILFSQGLLALICYMAALVASLKKWYDRGTDDVPVAICGAGLLCYQIQAFFGIGMFIVTPLMWLAWAIIENNHREPLKLKQQAGRGMRAT